MDDPDSGNIHISIRDARQPQTKGPLRSGDSAVHPSILGSPIANDSRIEDGPRVIPIHLIPWKDDGTNSNTANRGDGYCARQVGLEAIQRLSRLEAVMM